MSKPSQAPEFVFRLTGMLEEVRRHGTAIGQACEAAREEAGAVANQMALVEVLLAEVPKVMARHCCEPRWNPDRPRYMVNEPHGCTASCTRVWQALHSLGLVKDPREAKR